MIIVSNTTPIITFSVVNKMWILESLFPEIRIPPAVFKELTAKPLPGYDILKSKSFSIAEIKETDWLSLIEEELGAGEAEAILLAKELKADTLLMDEQAGRRAATRLKIPIAGSLGILLAARRTGVIKAIRPILYDLRSKGRWFSLDIINSVLKSAGENAIRN